MPNLNFIFRSMISEKIRIPIQNFDKRFEKKNEDTIYDGKWFTVNKA